MQKIQLQPGDIAPTLKRLSSITQVASAIWSRQLGWAQSERIMLAVTGVLRCRYCIWVHSDLASLAGVSELEIGAILDGDYNASPALDSTLLFLAAEYAKTKAPSGYLGVLKEHYTEQKAKTILSVLEFVYTTNVVGNTYDGFLNRFSRHGCRETGDGSLHLQLPVFLLTWPLYSAVSSITSGGRNQIPAATS